MPILNTIRWIFRCFSKWRRRSVPMPSSVPDSSVNRNAHSIHGGTTLVAYFARGYTTFSTTGVLRICIPVTSLFAPSFYDCFPSARKGLVLIQKQSCCSRYGEYIFLSAASLTVLDHGQRGKISDGKTGCIASGSFSPCALHRFLPSNSQDDAYSPWSCEIFVSQSLPWIIEKEQSNFVPKSSIAFMNTRIANGRRKRFIRRKTRSP